MKVREVMSRDVVSVNSTTSVGQAAALMSSRGFTALPVIDDDRLVGIITEADVLANRVPADPRIHGYSLQRIPNRSVADVMTTCVESLTPGADVKDAADIMVNERIRCLPVVDGYNVVGVITRRDLVRTVGAHSDGMIADEIRRRLDELGNPYRFSTAVQAGVVDIDDYVENASDTDTVRDIVMSTPGVVAVTIEHRIFDAS